MATILLAAKRLFELEVGDLSCVSVGPAYNTILSKDLLFLCANICAEIMDSLANTRVSRDLIG